ncbi:hypothetical protein DWE74_21495, partial [Salmonella enterica]|nr:hypothetical protein [Salmonella enterica]
KEGLEGKKTGFMLLILKVFLKSRLPQMSIDPTSNVNDPYLKCQKNLLQMSIVSTSNVMIFYLKCQYKIEIITDLSTDIVNKTNSLFS